jgi:hypothetical protein
LNTVIAAFGTWGGWAALTAIGTVGAVIVAVGLQWWLGKKERDRRPSLKLEFDSHMRADEADQHGNKLPYLRLAVTNAEGKETARDVEILIVSIDEYATTQVGSGGRTILAGESGPRVGELRRSGAAHVDPTWRDPLRRYRVLGAGGEGG